MPLAWTPEDVLALPADTEALVVKFKELEPPVIEKLAGLKALESLDLSACKGLSTEALKAVAGLPRLRDLSMDTKEMPEGGLSLLSKCAGLETLGIYGGKLDDPGLKAIAELPALRHLTLWGMGSVTDAGLGALSRLTHLEKLTAAWSKQLTGVGFESLKDLGAFKELKVTGFDQWSVDGARAVGGLARLRFLELYNCGVSDEKFGPLSTLSALESLSVYADHRDKVKMTDGAFPNLKGLKNLRSFSLNGTSVTRGAMEQLVQPLTGRYYVY